METGSWIAVGIVALALGVPLLNNTAVMGLTMATGAPAPDGGLSAWAGGRGSRGSPSGAPGLRISGAPRRRACAIRCWK